MKSVVIFFCLNQLIERVEYLAAPFTEGGEARQNSLAIVITTMKEKGEVVLLVLFLLTVAILIFQTGYQSLNTQFTNTFKRGKGLCKQRC